MAGKLLRNTPLEIGGGQELECQILAQTVCLEIRLDVEKRMLAQPEFRRTVGQYHQNTQLIELTGEIRQDVDGRHVGPVQVIEEQHGAPLSAQLLKEGGEFQLEALLRVGLSPTGARRASRCGPDLSMPAGSQTIHQPRHCGISAQQRLQTFQQREIGFRTGQPFRAASACNRDGSGVLQLSQEILNQRGLSHSGFARHANDPAPLR